LKKIISQFIDIMLIKIKQFNKKTVRVCQTY
jgi:hypothetical protein